MAINKTLTLHLAKVFHHEFGIPAITYIFLNIIHIA